MSHIQCITHCADKILPRSHLRTLYLHWPKNLQGMLHILENFYMLRTVQYNQSIIFLLDKC